MSAILEEQASAEAGIRRFNESVTEAFNRQDAATMAGFWTEQARLLPPGGEMLIGRSAVQATGNAPSIKERTTAPW